MCQLLSTLYTFTTYNICLKRRRWKPELNLKVVSVNMIYFQLVQWSILLGCPSFCLVTLLMNVLVFMFVYKTTKHLYATPSFFAVAVPDTFGHIIISQLNCSQFVILCLYTLWYCLPISTYSFLPSDQPQIINIGPINYNQSGITPILEQANKSEFSRVVWQIVGFAPVLWYILAFIQCKNRSARNHQDALTTLKYYRPS